MANTEFNKSPPRMKQWQRGTPVAELKRIASIFRNRCPHAQSDLGLPNPPTIAKAIESGSLAQIGDGFAIVRRAARRSVHRDFAGRRMVIDCGDVLVSRLAPPRRLRFLFRWLKELQSQYFDGGHAVWIEHFQEDCRTIQKLVALDFCCVGTKVSAFSDIKGLYVAGRRPSACCDAIELSLVDKLSLKSLGIFLDSEQIAVVSEELATFSNSWAVHYSNYNNEKSWAAFSLIGFADDPCIIAKPSEMKASWKRENKRALSESPRLTRAAYAFPRTLRMIRHLPGTKERVRFMRLKGQGLIQRHADICDKAAGTSDDAIVRLHIPIVTQPSVVFQCWDHLGKLQSRSFAAGELFYLDQRKPHRVVNGSKADRIHLVVDTTSSRELRTLLTSNWPSFEESHQTRR